MQKQHVFKVGDSVCFSEFLYVTETPEIGKIVAYLPERNETSPYLIDLSQTQPLSGLSSAEIDAYLFENSEMIRWASPHFMRIYSAQFYQKAALFIKLFSRHAPRIDHFISLRNELLALYRSGRRSFYGHVILAFLWHHFKNLLLFVGNVLVQGTLWLVFGNVVRLYQNFYEKYRLRRDTIYAQFRIRSAVDPQVRAVAEADAEALKLRIDQVNECIASSTNHLLALIFSVASLVIAILSFKR